MSYKIIDKWLTPNPYSRPQKKLQPKRAIVIHWIAVPNGRSLGVYNFFEGRKKGTNGYGSAHETIDLNGDVWRMIPENEVAYHVGSKTYTKESLAKFGNVPNNNTYGIECTHIDDKGTMTSETYSTLVERVADLCKMWNLDPFKDLWLHKEVVGWKECHKWFCDNPTEWQKFKKLVNEKLNPPQLQTKPDKVETPPVTNEGGRKLNLTNTQFAALENAIKVARDKGILSSDVWLNKVKDKSITIDEMVYLNAVIMSRLLK